MNFTTIHHVETLPMIFRKSNEEIVKIKILSHVQEAIDMCACACACARVYACTHEHAHIYIHVYIALK